MRINAVKKLLSAENRLINIKRAARCCIELIPQWESLRYEYGTVTMGYSTSWGVRCTLVEFSLRLRRLYVKTVVLV